MNRSWPRTLPALITAFDTTESLDFNAHEHNVSLAVSTGAKGVLLGGSTGEGPYLEPGERQEITSIARRAFPGLTIVCGISAESNRQAATHIAEATKGGADAVLVVTPGTLIRNRLESIIGFYEQVADNSPLPVFLYSVPGITGYELPVDAVSRLAQHPNILGIKDSGGDISRLTALSTTLQEGFFVFTGSSRALVDSHALGAFGAITASANYAFPMVDAAASGDREAQATLLEVTEVVERHGTSGTKFAASLAGMRPGSSRLPLHPLEPAAEHSITAAYKYMKA